MAEGLECELMDLTAPYIPIPTYFEDQDALEYVTADVPYIARHIDANFTLLLDVETRQPIGFRLEAPLRAWAVS